MIKVLIGNIFDSKAQTLVNTVNCVGVMGKGIALEFKRRFPDMHKDYLARCQAGEVQLGKPYLYRRVVLPWILNFPTKDHWRSVANVEDLVAGLDYLADHYREWGITSLAVPPLGTGLGQLDWKVVGPTLFHGLNRLHIPVELYAPFGTPTDELEQSFLLPPKHKGQLALKEPRSERVNPAWVALVEILSRVEGQPYHWPVGRVTFQKMAYVAAHEGLPLGLQFRRGSFGPFSPDLKRMQTVLINNGLIKETQSGNMFEVRVGQTFAASASTYIKDLAPWEPIIARIASLFLRLNTRRAEILATVMFAADELRDALNRAPTERELFESIMQWKLRRDPPFPAEQVATSVRELASMGWLAIESSSDLPVPIHASVDA